LGNFALILFCIIPMAFCAFTTVTPLLDWRIAVITAGTLVVGAVLHPLVQYIKRKCEQGEKDV
jgi:hypothetical protein